MTLKTNKIVAALQFAGQKGLDVDAALDQLTALVETPERPKITTILTTIGQKMDGSPLVVGWSTCATCLQHASRCNCANGPTMPPYVAKWVEEYEAKHSPEAIKRLSTSVGSPETSEGSFPAEGVPDSGETEVSPGGSAKRGKAVPLATGPVCKSCSKPVSEENADKRDDGDWECFDCQEGGN